MTETGTNTAKVNKLNFKTINAYNVTRHSNWAQYNKEKRGGDLK